MASAGERRRNFYDDCELRESELFQRSSEEYSSGWVKIEVRREEARDQRGM